MCMDIGMSALVEESHGEQAEEEETVRYRITANYKNCTYQRETWRMSLPAEEGGDANRKAVRPRVDVTTYYRWGTFYVELTETEKAELLEKDSVDLSRYVYEMEDVMGFGWDTDLEIVGADKMSPEELREIKKSLYITEDMEEEGEVYSSDKEYECNTDIMDENGWYLDDTQYGFSTGCVLTKEDEEEDDDDDEDA